MAKLVPTSITRFTSRRQSTGRMPNASPLGRAARRSAPCARFGQTTGMGRLRQLRLRAAAFGLTAWWLLILLQLAVVGLSPTVPFAIVAVLATTCAILSRRAAIAPGCLRLVEIAMFTLVAAAFSIAQYQIMRGLLERGDGHAFLLVIKDGMLHAMTLMLAYAVLIPNTWKSAAPVVLGLAAYPVLTVTVLSARHPGLSHMITQAADNQSPGPNLLMTLVPAGLSLFGIHVLATLRAEVFEARQLNQYRLGEILGVGGMGEVYLAEHRLLKRACALKVINPGSEQHPLALERFEREVQATARLSHPNIVEIYDYGQTDDGTFFYVMERLDGLDFAELARLYGPLPPGRVIYLLTQVCDGLAEAHAAGLIHRDLTPANLFAARVGRRHDVAKILDFGLVLDRGPGSPAPGREDGIAGTVFCMAPEQRAGEPSVDHRADLFSLGVVAYYLLTCRLPFVDASGFRPCPPRREPPTPPSAYRPDLPIDFERVILRCLEYDPAARYPDAQCVCEALAACSTSDQWGAEQASRWWQNLSP